MGNSSSSGVELSGKRSAGELFSDGGTIKLNQGIVCEPHETLEELYIPDDDQYCRDESDDEFAKTTDSARTIRTRFLKNLLGPPLTFLLELDCKNRKDSKSIKKLTVPEGILSETVQKLKLCIEEEHSIPACCQTLLYEGYVLKDQDLLCHHYIRDGDCLKVMFTDTVDVNYVMDVLDDMRRVLHRLTSWEDNLQRGTLTPSMLLQIHQGKMYTCMCSLGDIYDVGSGEEGMTKRLFLADCGAFVLVRKLHEELLKYPLSHLPMDLMVFESIILAFYWNLTADDVIYQFICKSKVLHNISRSFVRMKVDRQKGITLPVNFVYEKNVFGRQRIVREIVFKAMGGLCNFAEKRGYEVKVASNKFILDQLIALICCPMVDPFYRIVTMGGIYSLSFSSSTHPYLCAPPVLEVILENASTFARSPDLSLLKYFAVVVVAIIYSTSPRLLTTDDMTKMVDIFKLFLEEYNPVVIREKEVKFGFTWLSVVPYIKLAYHPHQVVKKSESLLLEENVPQGKVLNRYCIQCGLFSLSNVLQSKKSRDILVQEGLLDYLVCIPWLYPLDWPEREKARDLVNFMGQHVQLQPPSLINITKAKLASMYFGLEKVLSSEVHQLLDEAFVST